MQIVGVFNKQDCVLNHDSTPVGGVFKRYHFTVLDCRTVTVSCGNVSHIPVPTVDVHPFGEWLDITFSQSWMPHCHWHMWQCILHVPVPTVRQLGECWKATVPFHSREWPHCDTEHVRLRYLLLCVCVQVLVRSAYIHCRSTSTGGVFEHSYCYCTATTQRYVPSTRICMYARMYMLIGSLLSSLS